MFAYFVGIALVGAGARRADRAFRLGVRRLRRSAGAAVIGAGDRRGASRAMFVQRHVIIVTTAFVGAWTLIVGVLALSATAAALAAKSASNVWILYPTTRAGPRVGAVAWIVLGLVGTIVQLAVTRNEDGNAHRIGIDF